ncbi:MAG: 2-hydroxychromene-2-carboxylate isomerase [Flavobacteriaceae bacterium]
MSREIDYHFTVISPWAYMGHALLRDIARRHGAVVRYRPMKLIDVFAVTGGAPLPKRHPARQRYRWYELKRWRERRGISLNLHPAHIPLTPGLADRMIIALQTRGDDPYDFTLRCFQAVWLNDLDAADEATLKELATAAGWDGETLVAAANSAESMEIYERNTRDAIAHDCVGSPCYVLDGEPFWGQDRLELLEDALASGREPYRPEPS